MRHRIARLALATLALVASLPAAAAFHLFTINEAYSNASGTVQYLELTATAGGQQFVQGHTLVSISGTMRTFVLPGNLPGDTAGRRMLFGTAGVQAAFGVTPDFVIPNGFLHTTAGAFDWAEGQGDVWNHPALPVDGGSAIDRSGMPVVPSPQNFAGVTGTAAPPAVQLTSVVGGFAIPVDIRFAPGVTDRMFVVEKGGRIRIAVGNAILPTPFLDLSAIVSTSGERGLLGLAFHPNYASNRAFYVYYTAANTGAITIARYLRSVGDPNVADPASAAILFAEPHDQADNHNGGGLHFGPDGLLYASTGDGGGGGDPFRNGLRASSRLGKLLRIAADGGTGYTIPAGNMYPANGACGTTGCPETFSIGLRNPWRFSFDRLSGDLYIGDVGQDTVEEVDYRPAGSPGTNFGWGVYEGNNCYRDDYFGVAGACAQQAGHTRPVHTYLHTGGNRSINGGYVYRGAQVVGLGGFYVFGDYGSGRIWAGRMVNGAWTNFLLAPLLPDHVTYGQDAAGELYIADGFFGVIYRFSAVNGAPSPIADDDNDGVPNGVEGQEGLVHTFRDNDVFTRARLFAMQQYRDFLGREGDAAGIQFYDGLITGGAAVRSNVIESFFSSPEFAGSVAPIVRLYFATFLRIPDYDGLQFQTNAFRQGTPLAVVANNFTLSPEFQATYGSLDNPSFVALLYQNILNRTPSQGEIDFHVARLTAGETRGAVLVGFSESPEYQQASAISVYVTMMYVGMLRRAPEQAGFDFWSAYMNGGNSGLALIEGFLNAPEYRARFLP